MGAYNAFLDLTLGVGSPRAEAEMAALALERDAFHGEWNYTISPNQQPP